MHKSNDKSERKLQLIGFKHLEGIIYVETGLHIGAGGDEMEIMAVDNPVIKDPEGTPYIPGSSLKGKMRSLLELFTGKLGHNGRVHKCNSSEEAAKCPICRIFGVAGDSDCDFGPGRLLVRDSIMASADSETKKKSIEIKWENTINRLRGVAEHPRQMERVPRGAEFDFRIDYRVFDTGDDGETDKEFFDCVRFAMNLLQKDYLGGSGSRGYGRISFKNTTDENGEEPTLLENPPECLK